MAISLKILITLFFCSVLTAEEIKLNFAPADKVILHSETQSSAQVKLGETPFSTFSSEKVSMKIIPISSDPLQFDAELTEYVTDVKAGGKEIHFDVKEPSTHFLYAELAALKAPIRLEFISGEKGIQPIVDASPTLITTLLASKKNKLDQMLFGRLREWFSLVNVPLEKGKKIEFNLESKGNLPFKGKLIYVITDINDKEIHAHVTYLVERQKAVGDFPIETEGKSTVSTTTKMEGDAVWMRENSWIFNLDMKGTYQSSITKGNIELNTTMDMTMKEYTLKY